MKEKVISYGSNNLDEISKRCNSKDYLCQIQKLGDVQRYAYDVTSFQWLEKKNQTSCSLNHMLYVFISK